MQVAKWGNSLAIRIPADVVRELGLKDGDEVDLQSLDDGGIAIITERQRRAAALDRLTKMAIDFPVDYAFDREEANAR